MTAPTPRVLRRYERVIRYIAVGLTTTAIYSLLVLGLITQHAVTDPTLASALATLVTQPFAFLAHRAVTYRDVQREESQLFRFAIVAVSSFVLATTIMKLVDLNGLPFWIGLCAGWFLIPVGNYLVGAIWVFRVRSLRALNRNIRP